MAVDLERFLQRDPISDRGITVLLPMRNVAGTLEAAVAAVTGHLEQIQRGYELILINDGSSDGTAEAAARLLQANKRIRTVEHAEPQGYGAALRSGLRLAKYPLILEFTGDGRYDATQLDRLLGAIDRVDMVWGSRERGAGRSDFADWLYRRFVRCVFGVRVTDVDCRFRLFRRAAVRRIPIQSSGRFASAELVAKATFMNMLVGEVPVTVRAASPVDSCDLASGTQSVSRDAMRLFRHPQFRQSTPDREPVMES